ncbi:MAG: PilZ domain-containing protein [Planctomycetota bacterium]
MTTALRLTPTETDSLAPIPFERRRAARRSTSGKVTALAAPPDDRGASPSLRRIVAMSFVDRSSSGVGVWSDAPLDAGWRIELMSPPHGPEPAEAIYGKVVRCTPESSTRGYRLGIALEGLATNAA